MQHFEFVLVVVTLCLTFPQNFEMIRAATTADLLPNVAASRVMHSNDAAAAVADLLAVDSGAVVDAHADNESVRKSRALFFPGFYKTYYPYGYGYGGYYPYLYPRYGYGGASYYPYGYGLPGVIYG